MPFVNFRKLFFFLAIVAAQIVSIAEAADDDIVFCSAIAEELQRRNETGLDAIGVSQKWSEGPTAHLPAVGITDRNAVIDCLKRKPLIFVSYDLGSQSGRSNLRAPPDSPSSTATVATDPTGFVTIAPPTVTGTPSTSSSPTTAAVTQTGRPNSNSTCSGTALNSSEPHRSTPITLGLVLGLGIPLVLIALIAASFSAYMVGRVHGARRAMSGGGGELSESGVIQEMFAGNNNGIPTRHNSAQLARSEACGERQLTTRNSRGTLNVIE